MKMSGAQLDAAYRAALDGVTRAESRTINAMIAKGFAKRAGGPTCIRLTNEGLVRYVEQDGGLPRAIHPDYILNAEYDAYDEAEARAAAELDAEQVDEEAAEALAADILDLVEEFADADIARVEEDAAERASLRADEAAEVAAELVDEQVDAGEFRRLLDDPAVWRRALVSLQAHGIEVDTKVVEELRRATFGS